MAFEGLTEKLSATFKSSFSGKRAVWKESDVKEAMREIRRRFWRPM